MARDYLAPSTGPGLRAPFNNSTGPDKHGQVVNPPRMAIYGGFTNTRKGDMAINKLNIRKPGFEK
jgi:hypothetical protein